VLVECVKHLLPLLDGLAVPVIVDLDDIVSKVTKQRRAVERRTRFDVTGSSHLAGLPSGLRALAIRVRRLPRLIRDDVALALDATRQRRAEQLAVSRASAVLLCSERDREALGHPATAVLAPNGVDLNVPLSQPNLDSNPLVAFWGMMSYHANADGARWFRRSIVPELAARNERARIVIIGHACDQLELEPHPSVEVLGFAEDLDAALADVAVAVAPLRVGGGTRIKIIEAWARGIPVVSTVLGAHGLDVEHGREVLLADDPADFATAIDDLLSDEPLRARLIANGLHRARSMSWDSTETSVAAAMQRLLPGHDR
jgi:glycosyltransferase involved in cell wall biosynthesis